ncbi:MAG TPA: hypothetical protein ACQGQH_08225 [Xylella sp.]
MAEHRAPKRFRALDPRTHRWQHVATKRIVERTRLEMQDEFGLRSSTLSAMFAGRKFRGRRVLPLSPLGETPQFP